MRKKHALCDQCPVPRSPKTVVALELPRGLGPVRLCARCLLDALTAMASDKPFVVLGVPEQLDKAVCVKAILKVVFVTTAPWVGGGEPLVELIQDVLDELCDHSVVDADGDPGATIVH